jgi:hypothetical protein
MPLVRLLLVTLAIVPAQVQKSTATFDRNIPIRSEQAAPDADDVNKQSALILQRGEEALNRGRLNEAERNFLQVSALAPQAGGAYLNLGGLHAAGQQTRPAALTFTTCEPGSRAHRPQGGGPRRTRDAVGIDNERRTSEACGNRHRSVARTAAA